VWRNRKIPPRCYRWGIDIKWPAKSGLFAGGFDFFGFQGFFVILHSFFDILSAAFGLAVARPNADLAPERLERQAAIPDRLHDGRGGDAPAYADFLEIVDQIFLRIQKKNSLMAFLRMVSLPFTINDTL
jgi:hypothetical protein